MMDKLQATRLNRKENCETVYGEINETKADMGHIYNQPDPRPYFQELNKLGYVIPDAAKPIFRKLTACLRRRSNSTVHVLDLGCSYGVNAALLKYDLSMRELYEQWGQEKLVKATSEEVAEYGERYFNSQKETEDVELIGLDEAENAVKFAQKIGLLDESIIANLEAEPLPDDLDTDLSAVDLVISTGCVGYITDRSFSRLLPAMESERAPWFANFVLRMFPFDSIEAILEERGYVTEKLEGWTTVQRRFASPEEQAEALQHLCERGIALTDEERRGYLLAEFYLSRPAKDAVEEPLVLAKNQIRT